MQLFKRNWPRILRMCTEVAWLSLSAGGLLLSGITAQTPLRPLPIEEVTAMTTVPTVPQPALSPDGTLVAYVVLDGRRRIRGSEETGVFNETGMTASEAYADIVVTDLRTAISRNLTNGRGGNRNPSWSPDGRYLAFYSDRSGKAQLWIWEPTTNKLRLVSPVTIRAWDPRPAQWTPDSKAVMVPVLPEGMSVSQANSLRYQAIQKSVDGGQGSILVYQSEQRLDPKAAGAPQTSTYPLDVYTADLAMVNVVTGHASRLTKNRRLGAYLLSPTGDAVAFAEQVRFRDDNSAAVLLNLSICKLVSDSCHTVANETMFAQFSFSPNGKWLAYLPIGGGSKSCLNVVSVDVTNRHELSCPNGVAFSSTPYWSSDGSQVFVAGSRGLYRVDPQTEQITLVAPNPEKARIQLIPGQGKTDLWSTDGGKHILVWSVDQTTLNEGLRELDLDSGKNRLLWENNRRRKGTLAISRDSQGSIWMAEQTERPAELWHWRVGGQPRLLRDLNPQLQRYALGKAQLVDWNSANGEKLRGALLLPAAIIRASGCRLSSWSMAEPRIQLR